MERKSDDEICLFVRDEETGRLLFNAKALQALGINPEEAQQRGYPMKEQSALAEGAKDSAQISGRFFVARIPLSSTHVRHGRRCYKGPRSTGVR